MHLRAFLAICSLCLLAAYTALRLLYKLLRYRGLRKPKSYADIVNLLTTSAYELEAEVEGQFQLHRGTPRVKSNFSLVDYLQEEVRRRTEVDSLVVALGDSPFFKTLHPESLRAVAEALQPEELSTNHLSDCFYQSESGIQQLFVLPSCDSVVTLQLRDCGQAQFQVPSGSRVLFSPSSLACSLLSLPCPAGFPCTLHGSFAPFWSVSYAKLCDCLTAWPDARLRLLEQFWSHVNDVILLVFVEWLNLDALKFVQAGGYDELLARATDRLAEEQLASAGVELAAMSFYERRPLYRRLALRILCEIAECDLRHAGRAPESEVSVRFHRPGESVSCGRAFLLLDGRLEAVTHPTLGRQFAQAWQPLVGRRRLPGWVGLMQYFACSPLPFGLSCGASPEGAIVAEFSDGLMDAVFGSSTADAKATEAEAETAAHTATSSAASGAFESATRYLLRQLNPQLFRHDLLVNHRRLHRGGSLVRRGDPAETVEIVVSGRLRHRTAELGRGDCVGLVEGLLDSADGCWARDVVAMRESRTVSVPLSLVRAWVSQNHRLLILDRVLGSLCQRELDRQRADANSDDDPDYDDDDDAELEADGGWSSLGRHSTVGRHRRQRRREEALVGFVIDRSRFHRPRLLRLLRRCLGAAHGPAARLVSEADVREHFGRPVEQLPDAALRSWLEEQELSYPTLALVCSERVTRWTRLVLGFLDRLIVCCDADAPTGAGCEEPSDTEVYYSQMFRCRIHLAVFHPLTLGPVPCGTSLRFLRQRHWWTRRVFHVRCCTRYYKAAAAAAAALPDHHEVGDPPMPAFNSDLARLVRLTTGRAVGLAFDNGGGRRGLANLGALEALLEQGVAVDMVAGSGLGALGAAAWALHHPDLRAARTAVERLSARVDSPLGRLRDLTLPLVSAFTGAGLNSGLRALFGPHRQAEDLWLPCVAVSTDLVAARPVAHVTGTLWRSVRASCGRIGAYPPVWEPRTGRLLVDGAHTDRLPAGTLRRRLGARRVIAVALEDPLRFRPGSYLVYGDQVNGGRELLRSLNPLRLTPLAPSAADIQAALTGLAGGETPDDDRAADVDDGAEGEARQQWCLAVRPDATFSAADEDLVGSSDARASAAERWRGYWSARRRLRRTSAGVRAALHGWTSEFARTG